MESIEIFDRKKICILCNELKNFKVVIKDGTKKIASKTCLSCISKKNNEKLKARGYYKQYYIEHATKMKLDNKELNRKKKEAINISVIVPVRNSDMVS
jgi:hypothetical protein